MRYGGAVLAGIAAGLIALNVYPDASPTFGLGLGIAAALIGMALGAVIER